MASEKKLGRPPSGNVPVTIRLSLKVLRELNRQAGAELMTKSQYIARLVMTRTKD